MKKRNLIKSILMVACCVFFTVACQNDATVDDGTDVRKYGGDGVGGDSLYANAEGFDIAVWGSWNTKSAPIAAVTDGSDGGVRLTSIDRPDTGTYMGVNLAAGSGDGANADLNGNGFKQIKCKLRGVVNPEYTSLYIINGAGDSKVEVGKDTKLSSYVTELSETEWVEVTITGLNSTAAMSSGLIVFADNDGCAIGDWIEIKSIDWQDENGNSVVPVYVK